MEKLISQLKIALVAVDECREEAKNMVDYAFNEADSAEDYVIAARSQLSDAEEQAGEARQSAESAQDQLSTMEEKISTATQLLGRLIRMITESREPSGEAITREQAEVVGALLCLSDDEITDLVVDDTTRQKEECPL